MSFRAILGRQEAAPMRLAATLVGPILEVWSSAPMSTQVDISKPGRGES